MPRKTRKNAIYNSPVLRRESINVWTRNKMKSVDALADWKPYHVGGGTIEKQGYVFLYDETSETIICLTRRPKTSLCFRIVFDKDEKSISVDLSYSKYCPQNKDLEKSHGTLVMLSAAVDLIFRRSDINLYTSIVLTDNSSIECKSFINNKDYEIRLMDMNLVCEGCSWYSTIIPMFLRKEGDEEIYIRSRENIFSTSWETFLTNLPSEVREEIEYHIQFESETSRQLPAPIILNKIKKNRNHCLFFHLYLSEFLTALRAYSIFGKEWVVPLQDGKVVVCLDDPLTKSCWNPEKKWIFPETLLKYVDIKTYTDIKSSLQTPIPSSDGPIIVKNIIY